MEDFYNSHYLKGSEIMTEYKNAFHEIGGMLQVLREREVEIVPLMFAEATPGGTITKETYETLVNEMMQLVRQSCPLDGCLVVPHGAAVAEDHPDMDGDWLTLLREVLGEGVPVVGTLDPHANVSFRMVEATDALVAYKTNPHIDQREAGISAANILLDFLDGKIMPVQHLVQASVAISIEQQNTSAQPCRSLYLLAEELAKQPGILSVSIILGFPYADIAEMGTSFIIVADNSLPLAKSTAEVLGGYLTRHREEFAGKKLSITSLMDKINESPKPVLLLDMGDNVGGGASGDSIFLLSELEGNELHNCFVSITDPPAVGEVCKHEIGDFFQLSFGRDPGRKDVPYQTKVQYVDCFNGRFSENSPRHGGQTQYNMGKTVLVKTEKGNTIMISSLRVPPFSLRQLTAFGIVPQQFDIITAKGVNAPIAAYGPVCATFIQVNTPGTTSADILSFKYKNRRRPLFPFEKDVDPVVF
jgi:microcystin degradation protein MlrC